MIYAILTAIIVSYTVLSIVLIISLVAYEIISKTHISQIPKKLFAQLNKLRCKKLLLLGIRAYSYLFLASWLALELSFIDFATDLNILTSYQDGVLSTYFGDFSGQEGTWYFARIFFGVLGVKGFLIIQDFIAIGNKMESRS